MNKYIKKDSIFLILGAILYIITFFLNDSSYLKFLLFLCSFILIGSEVLINSIKNIAKGDFFDENFLMSLATVGAFLIKQYPEAIAVMLFYQIGEFLEDKATSNSKKSITNLLALKPDYANLKVENTIKKVRPEDVTVGDTIVVKPGEKIPLDGTVVEGSSLVDTSALTGESIPRNLSFGDAALSGFINANGVLTINVLKNFKNSSISKILDMVQNASSRKAKAENFITKFAKVYTPIVTLLAVLLFVIPTFLFKAPFSVWLYRALVFLVISCPCALVISIPLGFFSGIGCASKNGILIKGSNYLEALNEAKTVVFDKTGTLTQGVFKVSKICPKNGIEENVLIEYLACIESFSNHPIAKSILDFWGKDLKKDTIKDYKEISGHGISATVNDLKVLAGNSKLMIDENIEFEKNDDAGTIIHVAINNKYAGYVVISDEVKTDAKFTIESLKKLGIRNVVMLTGDTKAAAKNAANILGVDSVFSELLPSDKVSILEKLYSDPKSGKIVFVGDGINDAPVLSRADIGIAMGGLGSEAAIEASDIVIMNDEPSKLFPLFKIAKNTRKIVTENLIFAIGIKIIVLLLGALGYATMWEAVFADVGVTIIAVLNSTRILKIRI
ncbi:MAG: heavy metal translocating P-type ATPase [Clostridium sp.]|nr:heavy metal translocating P-type ATPase [Clostridium sp.]